MLVRDSQSLARKQEFPQYECHTAQCVLVSGVGLQYRLVAGECINVTILALEKIAFCQGEPRWVYLCLRRVLENAAGGIEVAFVGMIEDESEPGLNIVGIPAEQSFVPGVCFGVAAAISVGPGNGFQHVVGRLFPLDARCIGQGIRIAVCPCKDDGFVKQKLRIFRICAAQAGQNAESLGIVAGTGEFNCQLVLDLGRSIRPDLRTGRVGSKDGGECHCHE